MLNDEAIWIEGRQKATASVLAEPTTQPPPPTTQQPTSQNPSYGGQQPSRGRGRGRNNFNRNSRGGRGRGVGRSPGNTTWFSQNAGYPTWAWWTTPPCPYPTQPYWTPPTAQFSSPATSAQTQQSDQAGPPAYFTQADPSVPPPPGYNALNPADLQAAVSAMNLHQQQQDPGLVDTGAGSHVTLGSGS